jgi:hypothetical protein
MHLYPQSVHIKKLSLLPNFMRSSAQTKFFDDIRILLASIGEIFSSFLIIIRESFELLICLRVLNEPDETKMAFLFKNLVIKMGINNKVSPK